MTFSVSMLPKTQPPPWNQKHSGHPLVGLSPSGVKARRRMSGPLVSFLEMVKSSELATSSLGPAPGIRVPLARDAEMGWW